VEDVSGLRHLTKRMLESAGYTVRTAANGEEAVLVLERDHEPVHLMITDVVMPGMSGRTVAERLSRTRPQMKVLYMSGYTDDVVVRHGVLDAGMPFVGKPFTSGELIRKVREVLDSQN
jgi:two-component system cell cycle sensor histidine kinase/response regulator CckA